MAVTFTYDDRPGQNVGDAVRFLIGDTEEDGASQNISDGELEFILGRYGFSGIEVSYDANLDQMKLLQMALEAGRALVAKYAKEAHYAMGGMNESANQKAQEVRRRTNELERLVARSARPRFLGQSQAVKDSDAAINDLVKSVFGRGMMENVNLDTA